MTAWEYTLLFTSVLMGGLTAYIIRRHYPALLALLLSFSGAYILGIAALHLLPVAFSQGNRNPGLWLLLGFFVQILLEQLSRGVEHGHVHAHPNASPGFGVQILIGLCLHSFIEGMPLSSYAHLHGSDPSASTVNHLLFGIILHKVPAAFALVILLIQSGFSRTVILSSLLLFAAMSPLGAWLAEQWIKDDRALSIIMAVVIGSFLHISTTILFEADSTHQHTISWRKLLSILLGFGIAILTLG